MIKQSRDERIQFGIFLLLMNRQFKLVKMLEKYLKEEEVNEIMEHVDLANLPFSAIFDIEK